MSMAPDPLPTLPFSTVDEAVQLLDSPSEPWSIQLDCGSAAGLTSRGCGMRWVRR